MGVLTITVDDTSVTVNGTDFTPETVITLEQMTYRPDDGTTGMNAGPGGVIGFTDQNGQFTIPFSRQFVIGKRSTPGVIAISAFEGPLASTDAKVSAIDAKAGK